MRPAETNDRLQSVRFVPAGTLARPMGERVAALVSRHVGVPCRYDHVHLVGDLRLLPGREQADADHLLERLEEHAVDRGTVVVGITENDLALPVLTHVFGGAREGGHTAVVSLARLKQEYYGLPPDVGLFKRRIVAEVLHEIGHLGGLTHCDAYDCLMHFSPDVESIDLRGTSFCPVCADLLPEGFLPRRHA